MIFKLIIACLFDKRYHCFKDYGISLLVLFMLPFFFISCKHKVLPNQDMIDLLKASEKYDHNPDNIFCPEAIAESCDSILHSSSDENVVTEALNKKANALLQLGEEQKAIDIYQDLLNKIPHANLDQRQSVMKDMANAYFRLGERTNCIHNHNAESCIYPISNGGMHHDKTGSEKAIEIYYLSVRSRISIN
jgi:tetratricopeptide (TPR) repeat protein